MSDTVIRIENLGKQYRIGAVRRDLLSEKIGLGIRSLFNSKPDTSSPKPDTSFWALKGVSFEVRQGEVVGFIGRNGAGKSTLLKILSRITAPTEGEAELNGRVGSLLEVGTGFHPELTGRENIFLNGAILGMSRAEIRRKFDEIVGFAEVEKFIDTPVKHYSSGMYVRLAFAVAAHLETEIMLVDEVLAVGDALFQKKCLGKIGEAAKDGRTVIFVSHHMASVKALCGRAILFDKGRVLMDGNAGRAVDRYLGDGGLKAHVYSTAGGKTGPHFGRIELLQNGLMNGAFALDRPVRVVFRLETAGQKGLDVNVFVRNEEGLCIHHSADSSGRGADSPERTCEIPAYALAPGRYHIDVFLSRKNYEVFDRINDALVFETEFTVATDDSTRTRPWQGVCGPGLIQWK